LVPISELGVRLAADFIIANVFIGFKKQHVLGLRTRYEEGRHAYQTALTAHAESHTVQVELRTVSAPRVPKEMLERLAFEKYHSWAAGWRLPSLSLKQWTACQSQLRLEMS
jgi:hypothetical protein